MARRRLSSLLPALVLAAATGCATAPGPPAVPDDARRALDAMAARWQAFTDLTALAEVVVEQGGERQRMLGALLLKRPASFRFEALSPFGAPLLLVTVHEGHLVAYDASRHEGYTGPATAETIGHLLGLPLEPQDLVAVLAGHALPPRDLRRAELLVGDDGGPSLRLVGASQEERIWLHPASGLVRRLEVHDNRGVLRVAFRRNGDTPTGFDLDFGEGWATGSVTYRDVVVGRGIEADRFILTLPKGAKTWEIR